MNTAVASPVRRDAWVIGLIGLIHGLSHFYQLALPSVFLLIRADWNISFTALGVTATVFYVVSGICQTLAGFAVDRFGAQPVLLIGFTLLAGGIGLMGLAPNYETLLACSAIAGVGNSVFHPADFGVLNGTVDPKRLGHAYSVHGVSGNLGWALAPATLTAFSLWFGGWRGALIAAALLGMVVLAFVLSRRDLFGAAPQSRQASDPAPVATASVLLSAPILLCFVFFMLLAGGLIGIQTFGIPTLNQTYHLPQHLAALTLTCFLVGGAAGILCGGFVATRARRHDHVAAAGMGIAAGLIALIGSGVLPPPGIIAALAAAGFCSGITNPSRDLLVRAATPKGSTGRVYGFVYSGLDAGSAIAPAVFGALLDHGRGEILIYSVAVIWLAAIATIYMVRSSGARGAG